MQKYNDAASKIQKKYRAYKSLSLSNSFHQTPNKIMPKTFHFNSIDGKIENNTKLEKIPEKYLYSNQKLIARKLVNVRQSCRFSPSTSLSNSNSIKNYLDDTSNFPQHQHNNVQKSKTESTQV